MSILKLKEALLLEATILAQYGDPIVPVTMDETAALNQLVEEGFLRKGEKENEYEITGKTAG
jgi:hypothetical protein